MTHVMTDTDCERAFKGLPARKDLELELHPAYVMLCQMYQEYKKQSITKEQLNQMKDKKMNYQTLSNKDKTLLISYFCRSILDKIQKYDNLVYGEVLLLHLELSSLLDKVL